MVQPWEGHGIPTIRMANGSGIHEENIINLNIPTVGIKLTMIIQ
jgi:hypothetical protein